MDEEAKSGKNIAFEVLKHSKNLSELNKGITEIMKILKTLVSGSPEVSEVEEPVKTDISNLTVEKAYMAKWEQELKSLDVGQDQDTEKVTGTDAKTGISP